jgi:hypothetical protein
LAYPLERVKSGVFARMMNKAADACGFYRALPIKKRVPPWEETDISA